MGVCSASAAANIRILFMKILARCRTVNFIQVEGGGAWHWTPVSSCAFVYLSCPINVSSADGVFAIDVMHVTNNSDEHLLTHPSPHTPIPTLSVYFEGSLFVCISRGCYYTMNYLKFVFIFFINLALSLLIFNTLILIDTPRFYGFFNLLNT